MQEWNAGIQKRYRLSPLHLFRKGKKAKAKTHRETQDSGKYPTGQK